LNFAGTKIILRSVNDKGVEKRMKISLPGVFLFIPGATDGFAFLKKMEESSHGKLSQI